MYRPHAMSSSTPSKDCLGCRLVGGLGCVGIGAYISLQARGRKGYSLITLMTAAGCFGLVGIARLTNTGPFKESS